MLVALDEKSSLDQSGRANDQLTLPNLYNNIHEEKILKHQTKKII